MTCHNQLELGTYLGKILYTDERHYEAPHSVDRSVELENNLFLALNTAPNLTTFNCRLAISLSSFSGFWDSYEDELKFVFWKTTKIEILFVFNLLFGVGCACSYKISLSYLL